MGRGHVKHSKAIVSRVQLVSETKLHAYMLTTAQEGSLGLFSEDAWRGVFPSVNPRTASALLNLGFLEFQRSKGKNLYRLTARGREMLTLLQNRDA